MLDLLQQGNEATLLRTVRAQFKANMREVDDEKVGPRTIDRDQEVLLCAGDVGRAHDKVDFCHCADVLQIKEQKEA
jgi:hypothetical protein